MLKSNTTLLKRLPTPAAWKKQEVWADVPSLPSSVSVYAMAKQVAIAREVEAAGFPTREPIRDPDGPDQRSTYTVRDFRGEYLNGQIDPGEVEDWSDRFTPEARRRLTALCSVITTRYGWHPKAVQTFILTGLLPAPIRPIQVDWEGEREPVARRIVLTIDPNCSANEVKDAYLSIREQVLEEKPRRTGERNLALSLQEYDLRTEELGTWESKKDHWNELVSREGRPAEWKFDDRRSFQAEVESVHGRPVHPRWKKNIPVA